MCLLKLNHHDLTSKIHTVKSYKVTHTGRGRDQTIEMDTSRLMHDLCSLSGACAVVFQLCRYDPLDPQQGVPIDAANFSGFMRRIDIARKKNSSETEDSEWRKT